MPPYKMLTVAYTRWYYWKRNTLTKGCRTLFNRKRILHMGRVLAIDYGRKRIGLALSDETQTIAQSIQRIDVPDEPADFVVQELKQLAKDNDIQLILVGLPLGLDEKPTQMSQEVESFVAKITPTLQIECKLWNETSTSELAKMNLKGNIKERIDSEAARIMLQEYLDFQATKI